MPVTWKTTDSFERLLAAWWASSETHKPNYRLIAKYYGKGTTYDSIEGRFRHIKRQAEALKAESSASASASASADGAIDLDSPSASFNNGSSSQNGTPKKGRAPRTPRKDKDKDANGNGNGVLGGRVGKNGTTPTRGGRGRGRRVVDGDAGQQGVKVEMVSAGESSQSGSMLDEWNSVVDGEVDWMGESEVGDGRGRGGLANGGGAEEYYWNVGDGEGEVDAGDMV